MREQKIKIIPFEVLTVLDYKALQEPNRHGSAEISARISSQKEQEYLAMARNVTWIEIVAMDDNGSEQVLFYGVLQCMTMKKESVYSVMKLEISAGTILLEGDVHTRSFQAKKITYKDAIDTCNSEYLDSGVIMTVGKGEMLPHFILQYKEDDWTFLNRMCAMAGGLLVSSCSVKGIKYFFGMPKKNRTAIFETDSYAIENKEVLSYVIDSREIHEIGETAKFMGKEFTIWKIVSGMKGNELCHTYYISENIKRLIKNERKYQERITGASLYGTITDVEDEKVQIKILDDENQEKSGKRWFSFSTIYSSADGAGWYCMPERGDKVRLYMPSSDESEAYVCSAVHEEQGGGVRTDPEHKIWRNRYGKEIRLSPESILITNNKGSSVELSDSQGVTIRSSGSVTMKAASRIQISSENSGIELFASNRISIQQGESEVRLQDDIQFIGTKVNIM